MKAVLMDYTGTILKQAGAEIEEMMYRIIKHSNFTSMEEGMAFWFSNLEKFERQCFGDSFLTQDEICLKLLDICEKEHGLREDTEALHKLNQGLWKNGPFYDDVTPFFADCKLPVYIITNNGTRYLEENFRKNRIVPAGIISAEDVKAYKPDPSVFLAGLTKAGCNADEVVHIGDSYSADYVGARELGIRSILIDRKNRDSHDCEKVTDLRDILTMITER